MKNKTLRKILSYLLSFVMAIGMIFSDPSYYTVKAEGEYLVELEGAGDSTTVEMYSALGAEHRYYKPETLSYDNELLKVTVTKDETDHNLQRGFIEIIALQDNFETTISFMSWNTTYYIKVIVGSKTGISPNVVSILVDSSVNLTLNGATASSWSSSNSTVASVTMNSDNTATVTGNQAGTATITVNDTNGNTYTATVTVVQPEITVTPENKTVYIGDTVQLEATISPEGIGGTVSWSSNNSGVASVNESGLVSANSVGTAIITATANGVSASSTIVVEPKPEATGIELNKTSLTIYEGSSEQLTVTLLPLGTDDTISSTVWESSNSNVPVGQDGLVHGNVKGNTAVITVNVTTTKGKSFSATANVTVVEAPEYVWALDSSGVLEEGEKYVIVAENDSYAMKDSNGSFDKSAVSISDDGIFLTTPDNAIVWTYTNGDFVSENGNSIDSMVKNLSYNANQTITDHQINYITSGSAGMIYISSRRNTNFHSIGFVDGSFQYLEKTIYQLRLYKYQESKQSLTASFYITKDPSNLDGAELGTTLSSAKQSLGSSIAAKGWYTQADLGEEFKNLELIGVSVNGTMYTSQEAENLYVTVGKDIVKYYYLRKEVIIDYYYLEIDSVGKEKETLLGETYTTKDGQHRIYPPVFNGATLDSSVELVTPWPIETKREDLVNKQMRLYDENGTLIREIASVSTELQLIQNNDAGDPIPGSTFTLKIYFVKPAQKTGNFIQLPTVFRDFQGDGALFEYELGGTSVAPSYAYTLYDASSEHPNGVDGQTLGLVEDTLVNGKIVYKASTVAYVADLISRGIRYSPFEGKVPLVDHVFAVGKDNLGSADSDDFKNALADGEVTYDEIVDAYTGAYYLLSHVWDDDGNDHTLDGNAKEYNVAIPELHAIQLFEYSDGIDTYYEYDANTYETKVENGVVYNTEKPVGDLPAQNAYYHPVDGLGYSENIQEGPGANYLFTTVGEGKFVFNKEKNLYFDFTGDDDVYLFINGKLAVDVGGAHMATTGRVNLNDIAEEFNLVDDGIYDFTFFHAERRSTGSNFKIRTNIEVTAPSMITNKNAYQNNEMVVNGSIVDSGYPVVYEFILKNDGDTNMYNLSFVDETLGVRLYPTGYQAGTSKVDGLADQASINGGYATTIGQKLSNAISYGDIQICIYKEGSTTYTVPKNTFETSTDTTYSYQPKLRTDVVDKPAVEGDYGTFGSYQDGQATFVTIADQYKALYPDNEQTEANYQQFLEDLLRNGLDPEVTMILRGFNRTLGQNETYTNRLNTYGTDSNLREIPGTGSTTVRTLNIEPVMFVIDFGKSVTYTESQIFNQDETTNMSLRMYDGENYVLPTAAQSVVKAIDQQDVSYGTGTFDSQHSFTYTLKKFMSGIDTFRFQVTPLDDQGQEISEDALTKNLYMIPATTVYYEDDFSDQTIVKYTDNLSTRPANYFEFDGGIKYFGDWTVYTDESNTNVANQNNDEIGFGDKTDDTYGYDENYGSCSLSSSGSSMKLTYNSEQARLSTATFKFTGTGLEIYSRTNIDTGKVNLSLYRDADVEAWKTKYSQAHFDPQRLTVEIDKSSGSAKVTYRPPEVYKMVESDNLYKSGDLYQIPVITVNDLPYGEYYAVLEVYDADNIDVEGVRKDFYLDAIRISNPLGNPEDVSGYGAEAYKADNEDHAVVTEARSILITESTDFSVDTEQSGAVYIDRNQEITDDDHNVGYSSQDYEDYGPKHEVYLRSGQAIAFNINSNVTYAKVEIGLKVPSMGSASSVEVKINNDQTITLTSATDMYYDITDAVTEDGTIVIANANSNEDSILAITRIKLTGVSYATNESVETAALFTSNQRTVQLANQYLLEADNTPEEPVTPSEPETPTDPEETETPEEPETPVEPEQPAEEEKPQSSFDKFFNGIKNAIKKVIGSIKGLFPRKK